jgi:adenosylcobinamide-GDP ribazoletransferase
MLRSLGIALIFLTIMPIRLQGAIEAEDLRRSAGWFPLVGWLLAAGAGLCLWLGEWLALPPLIGGILAVALTAWLSRGLHLDGLADLFDALGGASDPARRLAIMKDSSLGTFGTVALVLLLLLKSGCLAGFADSLAGAGWLLFLAPPVAARWAMTALACQGRYPRATGTGHAFVGRVARRQVAVGAVFLLPVLFAGFPGLTVLAAALFPAFWLAIAAPRLFGGVTGDVLGASCELGEAAGWLTALIWLSV